MPPGLSHLGFWLSEQDSGLISMPQWPIRILRLNQSHARVQPPPSSNAEQELREGHGPWTGNCAGHVPSPLVSRSFFHKPSWPVQQDAVQATRAGLWGCWVGAGSAASYSVSWTYPSPSVTLPPLQREREPVSGLEFTVGCLYMVWTLG